MLMGSLNWAELEQRAWKMFERRFLRKADSAETQEQLDSQLDQKLASLGEQGGKRAKLMQVVAQAQELWAKRGQLRKQDMLYLAAALLYFISPLDAVPDLLPGAGYVDDVLIVSAIVGLTLKSLHAIGTQGKEQVEQWIEQQTEVVLERIDESATTGVQKAVVAVAIGLWGTTTAAAISLAVGMALGTHSVAWLTYVVLTSAMIITWNTATAWYFWDAYSKLEGKWQTRLRDLVIAKFTLYHGLMLAAPIVVLLSLGVARLLITR
jgi:uncharacterized membrane protein YkvA (DUF1232 family)